LANLVNTNTESHWLNPFQWQCNWTTKANNRYSKNWATVHNTSQHPLQSRDTSDEWQAESIGAWSNMTDD